MKLEHIIGNASAKKKERTNVKFNINSKNNSIKINNKATDK